MEFGDASGTALMDVRARTWCRKVCDAIDPRLMEMLPSLGSSLEPAGPLLPLLAAEWGLSPKIVVSGGGGDNMMAAIGTGNTNPGVVTASLGTSGTIFACADKPVIDSHGEIAAFCDSADHWMPLLCTMNVTVATEAFRHLFGWDHARMDAEISSVPPGADGLLFLPYLQGERTPNLPHGCGVLHGMTTSNLTPAHMARAAMAGVTLGMAYGLRRMESLGLKPTEIRLTGGGSQSPVWRQILADVFGYPVVTMESAEGAALGAAITCWKCFVILIADECCQHGHCTFPCETSSHARRGSWPHNDTPHELYSLFIKSRDANGNAALSCRRRDPGHSPRTRQNGFHLLGQPVLGGLADGLPDLRRDGQRIVRTALGGRLGGRLTRQPNGRPRGLDGSEHRGRLALKVVY